MQITTADRPGLLTDIVKVLKDISVNVISAEVQHVSHVSGMQHSGCHILLSELPRSIMPRIVVLSHSRACQALTACIVCS